MSSRTHDDAGSTEYPARAHHDLGGVSKLLCEPIDTEPHELTAFDREVDAIRGILGAKGVINRKDFSCWGQLPTVNSPEYAEWTKEARKFGKAIWDITGKKDVDIVFEHPGEQTFPVSTLVAKRGGMIVFCAGTTGFNITFDARYVWMRQKRIQGSHFAHLKQAAAAKVEKTPGIDPAVINKTELLDK